MQNCRFVDWRVVRGTRGKRRIVNFKSMLVVAMAAASLVLPFGFFAAPAGAATNSSTTTTVFDATTNGPWSNTETFGATAYDTAVVTPDVLRLPEARSPTPLFTYSDVQRNAQSPRRTVTVESPTARAATPTRPGPSMPAAYSFDATYLSGRRPVNDPAPAACARRSPINSGDAQPSFHRRHSRPRDRSRAVASPPQWPPNSDVARTSVTSATTNVCTDQRPRRGVRQRRTSAH